MPTATLTRLKIDRVSYCGRGMNKHATIALYKSKSGSGSTATRKTATLAATEGDLEQGDETMAEPTTADLTKTIEGMKATVAKAERVLKASKDEKLHMADMTPEQSDAFMAKTPDERAACMKKAADDAVAKAAEEKKAADLAKASDESLTVDGVTIMKSANPGLFAIVKSQQAKIAENAAEIAKANERTEMVTLEKRATDEFAHLPGTATEKAGVLKLLKSAPEAVRTSAEAILKAAEAMAKGAFGRVGTSKSGDGKPATDDAKKVWKGKVAELRKAYPTLDGERILDKAHELYPTEFAAAYPDTATAVAKSTEAALGVIAV